MQHTFSSFFFETSQTSIPTKAPITESIEIYLRLLKTRVLSTFKREASGKNVRKNENIYGKKS